MRVLITGGAGFIAFHLAKALQKREMRSFCSTISMITMIRNQEAECGRSAVVGYMPLHVVDIRTGTAWKRF